MELQNLKELGLSAGEIRVYSAILNIGISNLNKIQEKTGIERRNIYDILNKLIEKGLISYTIEKGKRTYQCTHPNKLLDEIKKKETSLSKLKEEIPKLKDLYDVSRPDIKAEIFRGEESIKTLLSEILEHNESYWMGGNSFEDYNAVSENLQIWFNHWMDKRVKQKHLMHDLVSHGTFLKGLEPGKREKHKKQFYEYCELPEGIYTPMVVIIFGDKVIQVLWSKQPFAFVLDSKEIKDSFMKYFKHFWKVS